MDMIREQQLRFHELCDQRDAIENLSGPLRAARDAHVQKARAAEDDMNAEIAASEKGLFEIKMELGFIARGLNGKTGPRPDAE